MARKKRTRYGQIARVLSVLRVLQKNKRGLSVPEITLLFNVSKRTIYRDIEALISSGFKIVNKNNVWRLYAD